VARFGFVGVPGMEPPPAVAQRQIGLQGRPELLVVRGGELRVVAAAEIGERERPLVETLLRFGIDRQQALGRGQRAGRVPGEPARARDQGQRDPIAGQPPRQPFGDRAGGREAVGVEQRARLQRERRRMFGDAGARLRRVTDDVVGLAEPVRQPRQADQRLDARRPLRARCGARRRSAAGARGSTHRSNRSRVPPCPSAL